MSLLRHRPAAFACLALASGITLSPFITSLTSPFWLIAACAAATLALTFGRYAAVQAGLLAFSLVLLSAVFTVHDYTSFHGTSLSRLAETKPPKVVMTGRIAEIDENSSDYLYTLETDSLGVASDGLIAQRGAVLLRLPKRDASRIPLPAEGSRIRVFSTLESYLGPTNPHEYASELKVQQNTRTEAQGLIHSRYDYYVISGPERNLWSRTHDWLSAVHRSISRILETAIVDERARGFVQAVVLGDRNDMEKETLNDFTTAGVAHILAVSGFNVAIVALVIAQLLRLFGVYWHRPRILITMVGVLFYSGIVGFQPSVVRALLMIELYLVAKLVERKPDPLNILMSAATIELLLRPSDLFDVSFQLSYAAVLGLVLIAPELRRLWSPEPKDVQPQSLTIGRMRASIVEAATLSLGASIACYPIIVAHFYRVSFIGLAANLPIIPLSALITALGFLLIPITAVSSWLGQIYGEAIAYLTKILLLLTNLCAHVPVAAHAAAAPSWVYLVFLLIAVVFCLRAANGMRLMGRMGLMIAAYGLLSFLPLSLTDSVLDHNEGKLQVLFFDVGQGDCILIHTPSNKSYFVDFGTISRAGNARFESTALSFLRAENKTNIQAGFVSHMHRDHYGGAPTMLENCQVTSLFTSGERVSDPLARTLDEDARKKHVTLGVLSRGDTLHLDSDITLYVLHPDRRVLESLRTSYGQHINSGSLAFRLVYLHTSFLFLGDVERSEEDEMLASYGGFLQSTAVKVAHHGSLTSSSKEFVAATHPEYAVISVGEHNSFGHPAPAIIKRWTTGGASVSRTDRDGAILFVSDGERVNRVEWR